MEEDTERRSIFYMCLLRSNELRQCDWTGDKVEIGSLSVYRNSWTPSTLSKAVNQNSTLVNMNSTLLKVDKLER